MKKALRIVVTVILIILLIGGLFYKIFWNAQVDFVVNETTFPLSTEQKLEDFKYLFRTLEQNFPYFEVKRQHGMDWPQGRGVCIHDSRNKQRCGVL